jgi:hypothetical protein
VRYFAVGVERLEMSDWRLVLYTLLAVLFWVLALGPGGGGTSEVEVGWPGAALNLLLLLPVWQGHGWPIPILAISALGLTALVASGGHPPDGPMFGALAGITGVMFLLLCSLGYSWRERD